jgi:peroxiredoxin Q/BCP
VRAVASKPPAATKSAAPAPHPLRVGEPAPELALPSDAGTEVRLADLRGKNVVVYFYPKDDTPGCTREAMAFRDARAQLAARDAVVLGVSKDSVDAHCRFRDKYALDFPLLSDREGGTIQRWGAWGEKNNYGKTYFGIVRSTVIVDRDGRVKKVFPRVKVDGHVDEVLAALDG